MGAKMSGMHLGVVNHEINDWKNECNNRNRTVCDWSGLTCLYLDQLQSGDLFVLVKHYKQRYSISYNILLQSLYRNRTRTTRKPAPLLGFNLETVGDT